MDNFTDKSSEVIKASFDKAEESANSQGEYKDCTSECSANVQSTLSTLSLYYGTTQHQRGLPSILNQHYLRALWRR